MSGYSSGYESEAASSECPSADGGNDAEKDAPQRRVRTKFTAEQISRLEKIFSKHKYLDAGERVKTAQKLNLTETQVKCKHSVYNRIINEEGGLVSPVKGPGCYIQTFASSAGQDLVPEQADEAETGSPGLPRTPGVLPASAPGSVPRHGRAPGPLQCIRPRPLPAARLAAAPGATADSSPRASAHDPASTFLLNKLPQETLHSDRDTYNPKTCYPICEDFVQILYNYKYIYLW